MAEIQDWINLMRISPFRPFTISPFFLPDNQLLTLHPNAIILKIFLTKIFWLIYFLFLYQPVWKMRLFQKPISPLRREDAKKMIFKVNLSHEIIDYTASWNFVMLRFQNMIFLTILMTGLFDQEVFTGR